MPGQIEADEGAITDAIAESYRCPALCDTAPMIRSVTEISEDTKIWRYMDLAKYVALLAKGIFFAQPSTFDDIWEGSSGGADVKAFRLANKDLSREAITTLWNDRQETKRHLLNSYGVSCWHKSDTESDALWKLYMPQGLGVAVQSTVHRFQKAIEAAQRTVEIHSVKYDNYSALELGDDPIKLLTHKRRSFWPERELRVIVKLRSDEIAGIATRKAMLDGAKLRKVSIGEPKPVITGYGGYSTKDKTLRTRLTPYGIYLTANCSELIERVYVNPFTSFAVGTAVDLVTRAFDLDPALVEQSAMRLVPHDHLEFRDS